MSTKPPDSLLDAETSFADPPFSTLLDPRILRALADLKFAHPTLVQAKAIPLLLDGKDVLAKARTGSGKTGAYGVPLVQRVLEAKEAAGITSPDYQTTRGVILVPTKELALQVTAFVKSITSYCEGVISVVNTATGGSAQRVQLNDKPDIIVSTPSRLVTLLQSGTVSLKNLCFLTIDEADLLLSYGHKDDLSRIMDPAMNWVPKLGMQGCLMSATLSEEVDGVKGLILRNPAILTLSEPTSSTLLSQYYTHTTERDKFLLIYVLLKLKLIRGKSIIFVNDVERGYRVKLFLEQFGIKSCVVNAELPLSSRYHVVEEFNRGVYDVVVASDEGLGGEVAEEPEQEDNEAVKGEGKVEGLLVAGTVDASEGEESEAEDEEDNTKDAMASTTTKTEITSEAGPSKRRSVDQPQNKRKRRREDPSSSFARGIDFTSASTVINFDLPLTPTSYMHRVGRTARAGQSGLALSFVVPKATWGKNHADRSISLKSAQFDEKVFERVREKVRAEGGGELKEWDWGGRKSEIEGFRYRMEDALRSVTAKRVADARREEVKRELLNSEKLKAHFAANPLDLAYLRHDNPLNPARVQPHLKHVPNYLMPKMGGMKLEGMGDVGEGAGVGFRGGRGGGGGRGARGRGRGRGRGGKKVDVLKFKG